MNIAIIGSGHIGSALAQGLIKAKHTVLIGVKLPLSKDSVALATKIGEDRFRAIEKVVQQCEVIIVTVPLQAIPQVAERLVKTEGKTIIETSNAFGKLLPKYIDGTTAIKEITGNRNVVKCFNTIGAEDLANPQFGDQKADAFVAGESKEAKKTAQQLALDMGFKNCYDLGDDDALPLLENLALTWSALAFKAGLGRRIAFKILHD